MAAYAAVASLMNSIEQMSNHPRLSNSFNNIQIQTLLQKARSLLDLIVAINYVGGNTEVEDLERRIARSAHAAEDVIESHIVHQIHAYKDVDESHIDADHILDDFLLDVEKKARDMDAIIEEANDLNAVKKEQHSTPPMESGDSTSSTTAMVGLDDELIRLLHELTGHPSSRHTISIVGMGGIGKTTLAKTVYANPFVVEHFDIRAWATLSQQYNEVEILSHFLSGLGQPTKGSVGELGERLHKTLFGRRYLVVLDDIWSVEAWDKVRRYFPDDGNGSRVVLTTRLSNVASVCGSSCLKMNLLDEDKSWKLFCEKTLFPFSYKDSPPQLERIGKEIVKLCKGLALSIVVIGGLLLKSPRTIGFWEGVAKNMKSIGANSNEKQESLDVLSLSYNHLPPHLKPCFLYMGVFEEDTTTRVSTISRLWVAEGFIRPDGGRVLEEIAEDYLNDLVDRNLILVRSRRYNGKIGSCGIHDLLRDLCIKIAEQQDLFLREKVGRDGRILCNPYRIESNIEFPLLRSLLLWIRTYLFVGMEIAKGKLLRVLINAYINNTAYLEVLYENINLRYLTYTYDLKDLDGLDHTNMLKLLCPSSISLVWNLQTLTISPRYDDMLLVAPSEIWKMRQLRHLEHSRIYLPNPSQGQDCSLENLQTLTTTVNLRMSEQVCKMIPNIKKLCLLYSNELQGYSTGISECLCYMDRLHKLESLKIEMMEMSIGEPHAPLSKMAFPSSLLKLSVACVELGDWKDLRAVGLLPHLQVLSLTDICVKDDGKIWSVGEGEFRSLKVLEMDLCDLYLWEVAEWSHFPVLKKLILSNMLWLRVIPWALGEIPTLELIRVNKCDHNSLAISAMRIKEDQLETQEEDDDALRVEVWVYSKSYMRSFKKQVETEQLTLDHIHLEVRPR